MGGGGAGVVLLGRWNWWHVLATSRQALGVAGEVRMVVPPMSLREAGAEISVEQVRTSDAVWLLSERGAAVVPGFTVDACNAAGVVELCRRLDGIPLALELAAVRVGSLSLDQLNRGLAEELSNSAAGTAAPRPGSRRWRPPSAGATGCSESRSGCCGPRRRCSPAASKKLR